MRLTKTLSKCALIALVGVGFVGCSDDESSPEAVTLDVLKAPGGLKIRDLGNGKVQLRWFAMNNEEDFDGFNVYGMKNTDTNNLAEKEGSAVVLLDKEGEPIQASRDYLAKFNYDPDKGLDAPADAVVEDGETQFSALPIHTKSGEDRIVPSCKTGTADGTTGVSSCDAPASLEEAGESVDDNSKWAALGVMSYTVENLKVGDKYCFLVLSSIDKGTKVSMASSNVACVVPKYRVSFSIPLPAAAANNQKLDLRTYLTECDTSGSCSASPGTTVIDTDANAHWGQADSAPIYIESGNNLVAGKNAGIAILGEFTNGFDDEELPQKVPAFTQGEFYNANDDATRRTSITTEGGYSLGGESINMLQSTVYAIAVGDKDEEKATKFHYHRLFISGALTGGTVNVEMMISKTQDEL